MNFQIAFECERHGAGAGALSHTESVSILIFKLPQEVSCRDVVSQGELAKSGHSVVFHLCADAGVQGVKTRASKVCRLGRSRCEDTGKQGVQTRSIKV